MATTAKYFSVSLKRSAAGAHSTHKATLEGLGLRHMGKTVVRKDIPSVRGMLYKVSHLVTIEKLAAGADRQTTARERARARRKGA